MFNTKLMAMTAAALLAAPFAQAQGFSATVLSNSTVLTGPGAGYEVVGSMPANTSVSVDGCLATHDWCQVSTVDGAGWVRAQDLTVTENGTNYVVAEAPATLQVQTLTYDGKATKRNAAAGVIAGAATGALAGPVGAVAGAVVGGITGAAVTPPKKVTTYVTQNPVTSISVDGDLKEGMVLPGTVQLTPVPDSSYSYVYVQNHPVLVDNGSRTVVRVIN